MYSSLYKVWNDENTLDTIQKLDDKFLDSIRKYVKNLTKLKNKIEDNIAKLVIEEEMKNIKFMLDDLFMIRINKLFNAIKEENDIEINNLTLDERKFFQISKDLYQRASDVFYSSAHGSKTKDFDNFFHQYIPIRILKEMNAIVGADLKTYGPFKPEEITILPKKNAETLIKHEYAVAISIKKSRIKPNE